MPIITKMDYKCDVCGKEAHDVRNNDTKVQSDDWRCAWLFIQSIEAYFISSHESAKVKFTICRECCEKHGWVRPKGDVEAETATAESTTGEKLVALIEEIVLEKLG